MTLCAVKNQPPAAAPGPALPPSIEQGLAQEGIVPLGLDAGVPVVYHEPINSILMLQPTKPSMWRLGALRVDTLQFLCPGGQSQTDKAHESAWEVIRTACEAVGTFSSDSVRGAGVWTDESGRPVLHSGRGCQRQERIIYTPDPSGFVVPDNSGLGTAGRKFFDEMAESYGRQNALAICGWIVVALAAGALQWRPHIWITGAAFAGKSTVLDTIKAVVAQAAIKTDGDTSAAGIRQKIGQSARGAIVDEAEPHNLKDGGRALLNLVRAASGGSEVFRGTIDGKGHSYQIRAAFCLASINLPDFNSADSTRIVPVELVTVAGTRPPAFSSGWLESLGRKILGGILNDWDRLQEEISKAKGALQQAGRGAREQDTLGTLAGAANWLTGLDMGFEGQSDLAERFKHDDAAVLLQKILGIRLPRYGITIGQALLEPSGDPVDINDAQRESAGAGVRLKNEMLLIATSSAAIQRELGHSGWNNVLKRLPGAIPNQQAKFSGVNQKCLLVPVPSDHGAA